MSLKDSLRALGVRVENMKDLVDGVNKLILPKEQKLSLLARYEAEENVKIPDELMSRVV